MLLHGVIWTDASAEDSMHATSILSMVCIEALHAMTWGKLVQAQGSRLVHCHAMSDVLP